jgi:hypothetical protein
MTSAAPFDDEWLTREHTRLMSSGRASIPWSACTASSLDGVSRARIAALWRARADAERCSVAIFSTWAIDLVGAGAAAPFLSLVTRATLDEVRHEELFDRLAEAYGAPPSPPSRDLPTMPDDARIPLRWQASREALELSVIGEGFSLTLLHELREHARDPAVRSVLAQVLGDEAAHARIGWMWLSHVRNDPDARDLFAWLQAELPVAFARFEDAVFGPDEGAPEDVDDEALRAHGACARSRMKTLYAALYDTLWRDGLRALGLELPPRRSP